MCVCFILFNHVIKKDVVRITEYSFNLETILGYSLILADNVAKLGFFYLFVELQLAFVHQRVVSTTFQNACAVQF